MRQPFEARWRIYASVNCVVIDSGNGLSPVRHEAITCTSAELVSFGHMGIKFSQILIEIQIFWFQKCNWKCRLQNGVHFVAAPVC